jgi:hypothetical protein
MRGFFAFWSDHIRGHAGVDRKSKACDAAMQHQQKRQISSDITLTSTGNPG